MSDAEKKDRSQAMVPGSEAAAAPASSSGGGGDAAQGGLAGALASALAARKSKVSHSGKLLSLSAVATRFKLILSQMTRKTMMTGSNCDIDERRKRTRAETMDREDEQSLITVDRWLLNGRERSSEVSVHVRTATLTTSQSIRTTRTRNRCCS